MSLPSSVPQRTMSLYQVFWEGSPLISVWVMCKAEMRGDGLWLGKFKKGWLKVCISTAMFLQSCWAKPQASEGTPLMTPPITGSPFPISSVFGRVRGAGVDEAGIEERLNVVESCLRLSQRMSHQEDWVLHLKLLHEAL